MSNQLLLSVGFGVHIPLSDRIQHELGFISLLCTTGWPIFEQDMRFAIHLTRRQIFPVVISIGYYDGRHIERQLPISTHHYEHIIYGVRGIHRSLRMHLHERGDCDQPITDVVCETRAKHDYPSPDEGGAKHDRHCTAEITTPFYITGRHNCRQSIELHIRRLSFGMK